MFLMGAFSLFIGEVWLLLQYVTEDAGDLVNDSEHDLNNLSTPNSVNDGQ
jgi:hypothetical protein